MWVNILCIFVAVPLVISWPAGYDEHALEEPLADDVPAYFKGIKKLLSHLHFMYKVCNTVLKSHSKSLILQLRIFFNFRAKNRHSKIQVFPQFLFVKLFAFSAFFVLVFFNFTYFCNFRAFWCFTYFAPFFWFLGVFVHSVYELYFAELPEINSPVSRKSFLEVQQE